VYQSPEVTPDLLLNDLEKLRSLFQAHPRVLGVFLFGSHADETVIRLARGQPL